MGTEFDEHVQRLRKLAQASCWNVSDIDIAWRHMREIPNMNWEQFEIFVSEYNPIQRYPLIVMAQIIQKTITGEVFFRTS